MRQDKLDPAGRQEEREAAALRSKLLSEQSLNDIKWLMSEPSGRRIMRGLLAQAGVYRGSYQGNANDAIFSEGQRSIGLAYVAIIQAHCVDEFVLMLKEGADSGR